MFIAMLEHPDFPQTDFQYMRTGIMAGSPCPVKVMQDVVEKMHMKEITIVYGQTEASQMCIRDSRLSLISSTKAKVIRNSQVQEVGIYDVVLDDIIELSHGCLLYTSRCV